MSGKYNFCFCLLLGAAWLNAEAQKRFTFREQKMGSPFTLVFYASNKEEAARAARAVFLQVDTLNNIFSDYLASSELNRLSETSGSGKYVAVSPRLFDLLSRSATASRLSHGSFDVTVGPLVRLWRQARRAGRFPDVDSLRHALAITGYRHMHLRRRKCAVRLDLPGMRLDMGGIAKGYIAWEALKTLRQMGFPAALVNAGGDIATGAPPPGTRGWRIALAIPEAAQGHLPEAIVVHDGAVATSGDIYQHLAWQGKHYSHIIDPHTGLGVTTQRNVTVRAGDGATADWLASACSVLPEADAFRLIRRIPGAAVCILEKRADTLYRRMSPGF